MIIDIIDIETTGLDSSVNQMTEFACITWDGFKELGRFHSFISHDWYQFRNDRNWTWQFLNGIRDSYLGPTLKEFVANFKKYLNGRDNLICAGKNFENLDRRFLEVIPGFPKMDYRSIEIGSLFVRGSDERVPGLEECCKRAGVPFDPSLRHTALHDCEITLGLLRAGLAV